MRGLDPRIHLLRTKSLDEADGLRINLPIKSGDGNDGGDHSANEARIVGQQMGFWIYILASRRGGTLYVGVTNNLIRRVFEHREGLVPGFTKRYGVKMLVYYERHDAAAAAIQREKNIKHWPREWKIDLILSINPDWKDLYEEVTR